MITKTQQFETLTIHRSQIENADYNPRKINDKQLSGLKRNLKKVGLLMPLVWNKRTGNLVSGHQRLRLIDGIEGSSDYEMTVSVVDLDEKTEKEQNIFINSTTYQGEFDLDKLKFVINEFDLDYRGCGLDEFDLSIIDLTPKELQKFGGGKLQDDNIDEDFNSEPEFEPSYEERAESIKELKKEIQSGYDNKFEGETYITLSFSNFKNKVAFCNRFDIPENDTIFKGEVFSGMIERIN